MKKLIKTAQGVDLLSGLEIGQTNPKLEDNAPQMDKKAEHVFQKLAKKKDKFLTEGTKDLISGTAAAGASTILAYPMDTASVDKQVSGFKNFKDTKFKDIFKSDKNTFKTIGNLAKKFYGGVGTKLTKTIPAGAITFGVYGATKRILDEIDD